MKRKQSIVIINGDESERSQLETWLSERYDVCMCQNGKEGIDYLNANFPEVDLVIISIELEHIDGWKLLRLIQISKNLKFIPVLMILDNPSQEDIEKALEGGAGEVLQRPLISKCLLNRVEVALKAYAKPAYQNLMEDLVERQIDKYIDDFGICKCNTCRCDLAALALNHLKPKYVNTEKGRVIASTEELATNTVLEVVGVIAECAKKIKENPRHVGGFHKS